VAYGQAWPVGDETVSGYPIPLGYANVNIDTIVDKKYNKIRIHYPTAEDRPKLGQNKGAYVAWHKRFIKLDHQVSSQDEDSSTTRPYSN
jgi:hypothetical protein